MGLSLLIHNKFLVNVLWDKNIRLRGEEIYAIKLNFYHKSWKNGKQNLSVTQLIFVDLLHSYGGCGCANKSLNVGGAADYKTDDKTIFRCEKYYFILWNGKFRIWSGLRATTS